MTKFDPQAFRLSEELVRASAVAASLKSTHRFERFYLAEERWTNEAAVACADSGLQLLYALRLFRRWWRNGGSRPIHASNLLGGKHISKRVRLRTIVALRKAKLIEVTRTRRGSSPLVQICLRP